MVRDYLPVDDPKPKSIWTAQIWANELSKQQQKKKGHEAKEGREAGADLREIMGTHGMNMIKMYENFKDRYKYC